MQKSLIILFSLFLLASCSFADFSGSIHSGSVISGEKYQKELDPEKRIELIKNRRKEMNSIQKGDYFTIKNNPNEALAYYLQVAEKLPDDVIIQKKIAHVYYLLKDWHNAYDYFTRVPFSELKAKEQKEMLSSLFFDESRSDRLSELYKIPTGTGMQEYYFVVDVCYTGIHNCITTIESYSGANSDILALRSASLDAAKVSPDYHYRNFVVAAKLYGSGDYLAAEMLSSEILEARPDYDEVSKLNGFALFELGRYNESKNILLRYLEKHPDDLETIVRLGEISFFLKDYTTSNLYLNNAILAGYMPKTNLERRLAYNYSLLGDTIGMMKVLGYLVQEPDASEDDFSVAISLALSEGDNLRGHVWAGQGLKLHPGSSILTPLYITSLRLLGKTKDAQDVIDSLSPELQESPVILLEQGILSFDLEEYDMAKKAFDQVISIDDSADFALEAQNYLDEIKDIESEKAEQTQEPDTSTSDTNTWWW